MVYPVPRHRHVQPTDAVRWLYFVHEPFSKANHDTHIFWVDEMFVIHISIAEMETHLNFREDGSSNALQGMDTIIDGVIQRANKRGRAEPTPSRLDHAIVTARSHCMAKS
jgi:hypothetical protein